MMMMMTYSCFLPSFVSFRCVLCRVKKSVNLLQESKCGFVNKFFFQCDYDELKQPILFLLVKQGESINQSINQLLVVLVNGNSRD